MILLTFLPQRVLAQNAPRIIQRSSSVMITRRTLFRATIPKRIKKMEDVDEDDESLYYEKWRYSDERNEDLDEGVTQHEYDHYRPVDWSAFPDTFHEGAEMDVKVVKVRDDYALCRPVEHPHIKGKITTREMDEEAVWKAYRAVQVNMIYKASIMQMILPDRVLFSLRRVRRILRDDFQPFTVAMFNVPYDLSEEQIQSVLEQCGTVLYVDFTSTSPYETPEGVIREPCMVTFLHQHEAMKAMRKWNTTKMAFTIGNKVFSFRIRLMKAHEQTYRQETQEYLDRRLEHKIQRWSETAEDRGDRWYQEREVAAILPDHMIEKEMEEYRYLLGYTDTYPDYTVKNCPRKADELPVVNHKRAVTPTPTTATSHDDTTPSRRTQQDDTIDPSDAASSKPIQYFKY